MAHLVFGEAVCLPGRRHPIEYAESLLRADSTLLTWSLKESDRKTLPAGGGNASNLM